MEAGRAKTGASRRLRSASPHRTRSRILRRSKTRGSTKAMTDGREDGKEMAGHTRAPTTSGVGHVGCHLTCIILSQGWDNNN